MADPATEVKPNSQGALPDQVNDQGGQKNVSKVAPPPVNQAPPKVEDHGDGQLPLSAEAKEAEAAAKKIADDKAIADAAEAKRVADEAAAKDDGEYVSFEDPSGQAVINLLKEAKVSRAEADAIFKEGIVGKDPSKINWQLLEEKLGKDKAALAKVGIEQFYQNQIVKTDETVAAVHKTVGGKENWEVLRTWVAKVEVADPTQKTKFDDIRRGIAAGGYLAELAAKDLKAQYDADPTTNGLGTAKVLSGDKPADTSQGTPLTRGEYYKLRQEYEKRGAKQAELSALFARRRAGQAAGI